MTFTGESQTGSAIMKTVAASLKPVSFELGGKNAAIVFADADFDDAVKESAKRHSSTPGRFACAQSVCMLSVGFLIASSMPWRVSLEGCAWERQWRRRQNWAP